MHAELGVPVSFAGIVTRDYCLRFHCLQPALRPADPAAERRTVTAVSVLMTAAPVRFFHFPLFLAAVPVGRTVRPRRRGAVDAALNNYVALHYAPRHELAALLLGRGRSRQPLYYGLQPDRRIWLEQRLPCRSIVQLILTAALHFISLPLWKRKDLRENAGGGAPCAGLSLSQGGENQGRSLILATFFRLLCPWSKRPGLRCQQLFGGSPTSMPTLPPALPPCSLSKHHLSAVFCGFFCREAGG